MSVVAGHLLSWLTIHRLVVEYVRTDRTLQPWLSFFMVVMDHRVREPDARWRDFKIKVLTLVRPGSQGRPVPLPEIDYPTHRPGASSQAHALPLKLVGTGGPEVHGEQTRYLNTVGVRTIRSCE